MPVVTQTIALATLPPDAQQKIIDVRNRNTLLRTLPLKPENYEYLGGLASTGLAVRSAHGNRALAINLNGIVFPTVYSLHRFPNMSGHKVKYCWMSYARMSATAHAGGGIPTLIEFSCSRGSRILYDYVLDVFLYTPDHYTMFYLVEHGGAFVRAL